VPTDLNLPTWTGTRLRRPLLPPGTNTLTLAWENADVIDCLQAWQVVVGEAHATRFELGHGLSDARHAEADRLVLGLRAFRLREKR
jgi:hypothetical protein